MLPKLPHHTSLSFLERDTDTTVSWRLYQRGPGDWVHLGFCVFFTVGWLALLAPMVWVVGRIGNHPGALLHFAPVGLAFWLLFGAVVAIFWAGLDFWGSERLIMTDHGLVFQRLRYPLILRRVESWRVDGASCRDDQLSFKHGDKQVSPAATLDPGDMHWLARLANGDDAHKPARGNGVYR